ncbi:hypothetical protein TVAG_109760 [Trichomonas vaginalis G3]|uniref:Uncharacterized protein n=1 Tax=Trichomonas vaginalis (strain ATCC PRA-98 / G3) TaxID=412133 RepID=A2EAG5_TRIV3|nr:hypothetical protein TVAG_109760 [Trichomonas vaginalis G3]|eukprot:XP_001322615.1 hypothetical protein [Trichomonas vaginalis G3]
MKNGSKVRDFEQSDPYSDNSPIEEFSFPPTPTKNTVKASLPSRKSFLNFGELDKNKNTQENSLNNTQTGSRLIPPRMLKQNENNKNDQMTGFEGFTLLTNSDFNAEHITSDNAQEAQSSGAKRSSILPLKSLFSKEQPESPKGNPKSAEIKTDVGSDEDIWATMSSLPIPSNNKQLPERKSRNLNINDQSNFSPKKQKKISENENFEQNRTEILTKRNDYAQNDSKEKMFTQSEASSEFEVKTESNPMKKVTEEFSNDLDNTISKFKRLFMNEFSVLMKESPQTRIDNVELFLQDISAEIDNIISTPKVNSSPKLDTLASDITNVIEDNVQIIKSTIVDTNNLRKTQIEREEVELRAFLKNLKNLQADYKNSTSAIILELDQERKSHDLMTSSESTRILEFQKQIQSLKLRQLELENTIKDQCEQLDEVEQSFQKLEMNQQCEMMKNTEVKTNKTFISEIKDCLNEIQNSVAQEPLEKVLKQFSSMERKIKNESELLNILVLEMKRSPSKPQKIPSEEEVPYNPIVESTKKKLDNIRKKKKLSDNDK